MTRVILTASAHRAIHAFARECLDEETGGCLTGAWYDDAARVTLASGPGPAATHDAHAYTSDASYNQGFIDAVHARSGGRETYLGEWHTHPHAYARLTPSAQDLDTQARLAAALGMSAWVMLIATASPHGPLDVIAVVGGRVVPLEVEDAP